MSLINVKAATRYFTSDGRDFADKKSAQSHESFLMREKALAGIAFTVPESCGTPGEDVGVSGTLFTESDLPKLIAGNADAILAALTVKKAPGRGRKAAVAS